MGMEYGDNKNEKWSMEIIRMRNGVWEKERGLLK
jgi:hypothetical protein